MTIAELINAINAKADEVKNLAENGSLEDAQAAKNELVEMRARYDLLKSMDDQAIENVKSGNAGKTVTVDAVAEFANAARHGFKNSMNEGTGADGGYAVPQDIATQINEYRDAKFSLADLVDVETVTTKTGSRTYKLKSQQTGFSKVGEGAAIGAKNTPQFKNISYSIDKYAGYFPVTNELLEDSDAAISNTLVAWIGDESRVTRNKLILAVLQAKTNTAITGLDGIKTALNVTLGQAYKPTSVILTNDDGLNYLDTLKDSDGHYLLTPSITEPGEMRISVGATTVPVKVMPNSDLASDETNGIPFIVGDLAEAVKFFDRKQITITTTDSGSVTGFNAFENDMTLFRAIEREDVKEKDSNAWVYCTLKN